jgi:hypothetical protein
VTVEQEQTLSAWYADQWSESLVRLMEYHGGADWASQSDDEKISLLDLIIAGLELEILAAETDAQLQPADQQWVDQGADVPAPATPPPPPPDQGAEVPPPATPPPPPPDQGAEVPPTGPTRRKNP